MKLTPPAWWMCSGGPVAAGLWLNVDGPGVQETPPSPKRAKGAFTHQRLKYYLSKSVNLAGKNPRQYPEHTKPSPSEYKIV